MDLNSNSVYTEAQELWIMNHCGGSKVKTELHPYLIEYQEDPYTIKGVPLEVSPTGILNLLSGFRMWYSIKQGKYSSWKDINIHCKRATLV